MTILRTLGLGFVLLVASSFAQTTSSSTTSSATPRPASRQGNCWQQAGISSSVMQQHREIMQNARSQVQSVCSDSALTQQEKRAKISQVRADARQQLESLLTSQQQEALKSCQASRGREGMRGHEGNPCGGARQTSMSR